jgi:hypothetical protein
VFKKDESRNVKLKKDIFQFAYSMCLNQKTLEELSIPEDEEDEDKRKPRLHCVPMKQETNEIIVAAFICAYSIFFISIMITIESLKKKIYCTDADADESFEIDENRCFKYIGWPLQLARLICATLFHVGFQ